MHRLLGLRRIRWRADIVTTGCLASALRTASNVKGSGTAALAAAEQLRRDGKVDAALRELDALKAEVAAPVRGVDVLRAQCFLQQPSLDGFSAALNARQALLEESRCFSLSSDAQELLEAINASTASFFELPREVAKAEPVFALVYDAVLPYSMLHWRRLHNLFVQVRDACREESTRGAALVEFGVAGGGSAAIMAVAAAEGDASRRRSAGRALDRSDERTLFACDTFRGMPVPSPKDRLATSGLAASATHWATGTCYAPTDSVMKLAAAFDVNIVPVVGDFRAVTLPAACDRVVCAHIDCDWHASTNAALEMVFPRLIGNGRSFVQIDDFGYWNGCAEAVDSFFAAAGRRDVKWRDVDGNAVWTRL